MARPRRRTAGRSGRGARQLTWRALADRLRARTALAPRVALVDAAPLAGLAAELAPDVVAEAGVRLGLLDGVPVALVPRGADGVRAARLLGAEILLFAVRARPLRPDRSAPVGALADHVGVLVPNPLIGPNADALGPRFPDLSELYDVSLREKAGAQAALLGLAFDVGVYGALPHANPATGEEYRMLAPVADWVGPGGVAEAIVARHAGMRVLGLVETGDAGGAARLARALLPAL